MKIIRFLSLFLVLLGPLTATRVITLAPALTEIVFALGRGSDIVGRTKFCDYPAAALDIPEVGGLWDPNLERMIDLEPDIVILYPESYDRIKALADRARLLVVPHHSLDNLYTSIQSIATALGLPQKGEQMATGLKKELQTVAAGHAGLPAIPTLLIAGRNPQELKNITLIGRTDFLNELLEMAGGTNAYRGDVPYPTVTMESILKMNPRHIIEFSVYFEKISPESVLDIWRTFPHIEAIKKNRVHIVTDPMWVRPGPRVDRVARELFGLLHPGHRDRREGGRP